MSSLPAATCYRHPERATGLRCSRCDRPICGECAVPAAVGQLCPDDARDRADVRRVGARGSGLQLQGRPVVTVALLTINTVMLLVAAAMSPDVLGGLLTPSEPALCRLGALNAPAILESGQVWRLLTVMVLHGGIIHWAFNSYALYAFGPTLEAVLGRARFLALYAGAGLAGAGASLALNHTRLGVGASGAIFGLLGALVAFFYRRREMGGRMALQNLLIVLALNLFIGARSANIDNVAHIGGFLAGLVAMAIIDAAPARRSALQVVGLALPFAAAAVLTVIAATTLVPGAVQTCVGV